MFASYCTQKVLTIMEMMDIRRKAQQNPLANVPLIVQKWRDDTNPSPNDCCALEEHAMNLNAAEEFI